MKVIEFKFSIFPEKNIKQKEIESVEVVYGTNGEGFSFKKEMNFSEDYCGKLKYSIKVHFKEEYLVDYYFIINLKNGEKDITDNDYHGFTTGLDYYTNYLNQRYEKRSEPLVSEVECKDNKDYETSVIIPTYNSAEYLHQAIESVYNQTYKKFEIILVDDNSTDNTEDKIKPYLNLPDFSYYKMDKNYGGSYVRNFAIKKAKGKYIAQLDTDDLYLPGFLENTINGLKNSDELDFITTIRYDLIPDKNHFQMNNSIMCPHCVKIDENDSPVRAPYGRGYVYSNIYCETCGSHAAVYIDRADKNLLNRFLKDNCFITHGATVFKKDIFIKNNGYDFDLKVAGDWDFWKRTFKPGNWKLLKKSLYIKKIHDNNVWANIRRDEKSNPQYYRKILNKKAKYLKEVKPLNLPYEKNSLDFLKGKNVVIYPFNKESHSLIRFRDRLDFNISAVIDYTIQDETDVGRKINSKDINIPLICSESKALEAIKNSDVFITLETPEPESAVLNYYAPHQAAILWYNLFECALKNKKDIYSCSYTMEREVNSLFYKHIIKENGNRIYYPEITEEDYYNNILQAQNYEFNCEKYKTKLIGVFGTAPCQGKFTTQIILKNQLLDKNHSVKHFSTEPFGELFGSEVTCNERIDRYEHKKWYRGELFKALEKKYEFLIMGGQGTFFNEPSQKLIEFIFPKKFDSILLAVKINDSDETIIEHLEEIEKTQGIKPVAFILSSAEETMYQEYSFFTEEDIINRKKYLMEKFNIPAYELVLLNEGEKLTDYLLDNLKI